MLNNGYGRRAGDGCRILKISRSALPGRMPPRKELNDFTAKEMKLHESWIPIVAIDVPSWFKLRKIRGASGGGVEPLFEMGLQAVEHFRFHVLEVGELSPAR